MDKLENVEADEIERALDELSGEWEPQRLVAAMIYKRGPSVPMLAEWLDVQNQTIYRWFDRIENEPIAEAVKHRSRPGRPSKLGDDAREAFREAVGSSPEASGYDQSTWTIDLAAEYLEDEFDVEYSRRHVRRLLENVGGTEYR